jgi:hypothetical protein
MNLIRQAVNQATRKAWEEKVDFTWWRGYHRWPLPSYAIFPTR